jgi:hypothetical protein
MPTFHRTLARMTTATQLWIQAPPRPKPPRRSPRTSLVLAALARQRRWERRQRRAARARRAAWFALLDPAPFDSIGACAALGVSFAGSTPLVYALPSAWCDRRRSRKMW